MTKLPRPKLVPLRSRPRVTPPQPASLWTVTPNYDFGPHFKHEQLIFSFFECIQREDEVESCFRGYVSFVKTLTLEPLLSQITDKSVHCNFKTAFILERFSLYLVNQLSKTGLYLRDVVFLKKLAAAVFANAFIFVKELVLACDPRLFGPEIERLQKRKITLSEENVTEINAKLWRMLESETEGVDAAVPTCLTKLRNFEAEFTVDEACQYIDSVFGSLGGFHRKTTETRNELLTDVEVPRQDGSFSVPEKSLASVQEKAYTLVLDLDETLVHCQDNENGSVVNFRPYLDEFLEAMVGLYHIVIFTAAAQDYADVVLDNIDPENRVFSRRLYRQHTKSVNSEYNLKDLALVTEDLSKTIIIDNVPENFTQQKSNGIFIHSWFDDPHDTALRDLIPLLTHIVQTKTPDVRVYLQNLRAQMIDSIQKGAINPCILNLAENISGSDS